MDAEQSPATPPPPRYDPRYTGYFECFNSRRYFEAHEVLEGLWLRTHDGNRAYYKGLIQFAGAFVHLQKQLARPGHPKDGRRARPAVRLFALAAGNLEPYRPTHLGLDVEGVWQMSTQLADGIRASGYGNPWRPEAAPRLELDNGTEPGETGEPCFTQPDRSSSPAC